MVLLRMLVYRGGTSLATRLMMHRVHPLTRSLTTAPPNQGLLRFCVVGSGPAGFYTAERVWGDVLMMPGGATSPTTSTSAPQAIW